MSERRLRARRIPAGRQSDQSSHPRLVRFETNSDLSNSDRDDREVDLDDEALNALIAFNHSEPLSGGLAQANNNDTAPASDNMTPPRSTPRRRRRNHFLPPNFPIEDDMIYLSETAGLGSSSMSSSQTLHDENAAPTGVMATNSGTHRNTRSSLFGFSPPLPGSGLLGNGLRGGPNSPTAPNIHTLSPRRSRVHRRIGSAGENHVPRSLSQGGTFGSLTGERGTVQRPDFPDFTYGQRRSDRILPNSTGAYNSPSILGNSSSHLGQGYNGNYLNDLDELSQADWTNPPPRQMAPSQTSRDSARLYRSGPWADSESDGDDEYDDFLSSQEYEDSLVTLGANRGNNTSRRPSQMQAMQLMRERFSRWSAENNFVKRPRDKVDTTDGNNTDLMSVLEKKGAVSAVLYHSERAQPNATDVWPDIRDSSKIPSRYFPISDQFSNGSRLKRRGLNVLDSIRPSKILKLKVRSRWDLRPDVPGWPKERLPTEMFEEIASYLSRDDIKSMRLVSREFDKHVSQVLFRTVVVPFNTEIYGMLGQDRKPDYKGKGKVKIEVNKGLSWKNANGDDVYNGHGLDVFRGFGPHIRKYGMSFDVDEEALAKPPFKGTTENHASFWGNYEWPFEEYRRFDDVAGLELAADETPKMKTAFSMLQKVQELALSLDSGLGWLKGPDRSIRARIIRKQPEVFGPSKEIPDRKEQAQQELWDYLNRVHDEARIDLKTATLYRMAVNIPFKELRPIIDAHAVPEMLSKFPYLDPCLVAEATLDEYTVDDRRDDSDLASVLALAETSVPDPVLTPTPSVGVLYSSSTPPSDVAQLRSSIVPTKLSKAQKEWLMETEWAQRAFLSSYMLAVMDNPTTFETVHTLNVARISSRYASALCRQDFWDALPQLKTVTIQVLPDWRNVVKDEAGYVETPRVDPQHAIEPFYQLLKDMISPRKNIKNLTIGWAAGGEHAEGIHARNKHILPAPVLLSSDALLLHPSQIGGVMLSFPYVQQLTLRNCWVTPPALQELVKKHDKTRLTKLTLQSVSLTAMPRVLANQNAAQNANQNANQNLNGVFNLQNQLQAMANVQQAHNAAQNNGVGNQPNAAGLQLGLPNGAAQQGGPPQQLIALQIQALQLQINHLQNQQGAQAQAQIPNMQAQLQAHLHVQNQLQAHIPPGFPPGFVAPQQQQQAQQVHQLVQQHQQQQQAPPPLPQVSAQSAVRTQPREGSWPYILDIISPGQNLADFGSSHSHADADRESSLRELELVSCGYVRLPHANLDESGLEPAHAFLRHPFFSKRYNALAPAMLSSKDALMGEIVQEVDAVECAAVNVAWFLNTGWEDDSEAVAVEFDGCLRGGEGRFSGVLRASDRVAGAE